MAQLRQPISSLSARSRRGFIRASVALLLGLALLAMIVHMRRGPSPWRPPVSSARFAEATRKFFRTQPTVDADDHAALVSAFESADFFYGADYDEDGNTVFREATESDVLNGEQRRLLIETVAQIIELRSRADAEVYAEWMRSRGYQLKNVDEQLNHIAYVNRFKLKARRDPAPEDTPWTLFKDAYEGELIHSRGGAATRPTRIVAERHSLEIWFARTNTNRIPLAFTSVFFAKMQENAQVPDEFDPSNFSKQLLWSQGQSYAGWPHWKPPIRYEEVIARDGDVLCARAQCLIRTATGGVLPVLFQLYYDPVLQQWFLPDQMEGMMYVNTYALDLFFSGPEF